MDQITAFLTRRNIIALFVIAVLAVGLLVGVRLVQQQTQLKSRAAGEACNDDRTFCIWFEAPQGGNPIVGQDAYVYVVGKNGDTNIRLEGTVNINGTNEIFTGTGVSTCTNETSYVACWRFKIPTTVSNQKYEETFKSTEAPNGRVTGSFTPSAPPQPSAGQKFTIGGKVTREDKNVAIPNVTINQGANPGANNKECNIGTAKTDNNGRYSISNVDSGTFFCLRPPSVTGYTRGETSGGAGSYEDQTASSNKSDYDFVYTPSDDAQTEKFQIFDQNRQDVTTIGTIISGTEYTFEIKVKNTGFSTWKQGVYKLKAAGSTKNDWQLGEESFDYTSPDGDVTKDNSAFFELKGTAPEISGDVGSKRFELVMYNGSANFAQGVVNRTISIRKTAGGTGGSPSPGEGTCPVGTSVVIPDEPTVTRVWKCTDQTSGCRAKGIPPNNYTCAGSTQTCLACATTTSLNTFPFGQCGVCKNNPKTQTEDPNCDNSSATRDDDSSKCTRKTKIDSQEFRDKCIDFKCEKAGKVRDCEVSWSGDGFELVPSLCTDPVKPFCQTTGTKRGFCLPEPTPTPPAAVVTCFVVSYLPGTRSTFSNCNQVDNLNNPSGSIIAGVFSSSSQTHNFTLPSGNDNKTLYARFLKLAQGESITSCTDHPAKCKDTTAEITLNVPVPSPSPSPVTGCGCQADNTCTSSCPFTTLTDIVYANPVSCFTPSRIHNVAPNTQDKNSYCNRPRRTEGDANADGRIDIDDYLYYLTAVSGGKVPVSVNPDFDGNGDVGPNDLTIWERSNP